MRLVKEGRTNAESEATRARRVLDPQLLADLEGLALRAERVAEGVLAGLHRSLHKGESVDFTELKPYSPGDDLRRLDWRVLGRSDRYLVRQFEAETNLRLMLAVDFSASMSYASGALSKADYASLLAAALASIALRQGDAVGLCLLGGEGPPLLPPAGGQEHLQELARLLEGRRPAGPTRLAEAVDICRPHLGRRGLLVLCSDLFDFASDWRGALKLLAASGNQLMVFQVLDREELEFPFEDPALFESLEDERQLLVHPRSLRPAYLRELHAWFDGLRRELEGPGTVFEQAACDEAPQLPIIRALARERNRRRGRRPAE